VLTGLWNVSFARLLFPLVGLMMKNLICLQNGFPTVMHDLIILLQSFQKTYHPSLMPFQFSVFMGQFALLNMQGDNIRKRDDWSKWTQKKNESTSKAETPKSQLGVDSFEDSKVTEDKAESLLQGSCATHPSCDAECTLNGKTSQSAVKCVNHATGTTPFPDDVQETESTTLGDYRKQRNQVLSVTSRNINVSDLSDDFSSTFMLDEELELEQSTVKRDNLSLIRRCLMLYPSCFFHMQFKNSIFPRSVFSAAGVVGSLLNCF